MSILNFKIDWNSLLKKGIKPVDDDFGIYLITGYQGSGKTYYAIYTIERTFKNKVIYTNIKSFKSDKNIIKYFNKIEDIENNTEDNCVFLIDELSKKYSKNSPQDMRFYSFLQQSRKHQRYVYMITQEYMQVPSWLRGVANLVYTTQKVKLLPLFKTTLGIPFLNENFEWETQTIATIIYKRNVDVAKKYDTFEGINSL